jgi:hypothetical protein
MTKAAVGVCKVIVNVRGRDRRVTERDRDLVDFVHHITSGIETGHNGSLMCVHNEIAQVVARGPEVDSKLSPGPATHRWIDRIECGGRSVGEQDDGVFAKGAERVRNAGLEPDSGFPDQWA